MTLSAPVAREELHTRRLEVRGFRRADGLYDIEGHLTDSKAHAYDLREQSLAPGEPIHDMWLRLTVDPDFIVRSAEAWTAKGPYSICAEVNPSFARLAGLKIAAGWNRKVHERIGGVRGCTHLIEMLGQMGTTAFQAMLPDLAARSGRDASAPSPELIDSCYTYRADGPMIRSEFPRLFAERETAQAQAKAHAEPS